MKLGVRANKNKQNGSSDKS